MTAMDQWVGEHLDELERAGLADDTIVYSPEYSAGLLRVAASDGYNTGLDTSNPFQVSNRPPHRR